MIDTGGVHALNTKGEKILWLPKVQRHSWCLKLYKSLTSEELFLESNKGCLEWEPWYPVWLSSNKSSFMHVPLICLSYDKCLPDSSGCSNQETFYLLKIYHGCENMPWLWCSPVFEHKFSLQLYPNNHKELPLLSCRFHWKIYQSNPTDLVLPEQETRQNHRSITTNKGNKATAQQRRSV